MKTVDLNNYTTLALKKLAKSLKVPPHQPKQMLIQELTKTLNDNEGTHAINPIYEKYYCLKDGHPIHSTKPLRVRCSAVVTVHILILAIEAAGLACNVRQASATTVPTINHDYEPSIWGIASDARAQVVFKALEPCVIWSITSWILPLMFGYFCNTIDVSVERLERPYPVSPFAFSIVRLILAHVAYGQPALNDTADQACRFFCGRVWPWHLYSPFQVVRNSVPGGYESLRLGAIVGVIVSIHDTIQRVLMLGQ